MLKILKLCLIFKTFSALTKLDTSINSNNKSPSITYNFITKFGLGSIIVELE